MEQKTSLLQIVLVNDNQDMISTSTFSSSLPQNNGDFYKIKDMQLLNLHVADFFLSQNSPRQGIPDRCACTSPNGKKYVKNHLGTMCAKTF